MSTSGVTRQGQGGTAPAREAQMWREGGRRRGGRGEQAMVPDAQFSSYYGRAVIKKPVWSELDIAGYLYTGGLAAASAMLGAGGDLSGRPHLRRVGRAGALAALGVSAAALVHDLGKPSRFYNMLRVFKPTSPMSVGSWILSAFGAPAGLAAVAEFSDLVPMPGVVRRAMPALGRVSGVASAAVAPAVATSTAVLIGDTAVPSWHEAYREMPFVFAGSALSAGSGLALLACPVTETGAARRLAVAGGLLELAAARRIEDNLGELSAPYRHGRPNRLLRGGEALTAAGIVGGVLLGGRSRVVAALSGAALLAASAMTRFGIFEAGVASAEDPGYTVRPQRSRLLKRGRIRVPGDPGSLGDSPTAQQPPG